MDSQEDRCADDHAWDFIVTQLTKNVDDFGIIKTQDKFECDRYYCKCRDDSGRRKTSSNLYETPKDCLIDFFRRIEGFWFG